MSDHINTRATTIGGTLLVLLVFIDRADIIRTAVLAGVGALVSFMISFLLKKVVGWWKSRRG